MMILPSCPGVTVVAWWIFSVVALVQPSNQVLAWTTTTTTTRIHRPFSATRTTGTTTGTTTTTRLYMFDWLQQRKPTPRPDPDTNDGPHHNPDNHDHHDNNPFKKTEDFFANWFQGLSGSSSHGKPSTEEHHQEEDSIRTPTTTSSTASTTTVNSAVHDESTTTSTSHSHPIISVYTEDVEAMTHPTMADTPIMVHATTTTTSTTSSTPVEHGGSDDEDIPPATRIHSGRVGWFDHTKGYGFLVLDTNIDETSSGAGTQQQQDIFVHYSAIYTPTTTHDGQAYGVYRKLMRNEPVEFQLATTKDGKIKASNVTGPNGVPVRYVQEQMAKKELTE